MAEEKLFDSLNYKDDLTIDQAYLDKEFVRQPMLYARWHEAYVDAQDLVDDLKRQIDREYATIEWQIRKDWDEKEDGKLTDKSVKAKVEMSENLEQLNNQLLDAQKDARLIQGALVALEHKKRALTKLADLFIGDYWSKPTEPQVFREVNDAEVEKAIRGKLRKTRENRERTSE